jgi:hypothetical protein
MWPWLLMPLAALTLYFTLHSVRESAPRAGSPSQTSQPSQGDDSGP